jgi:hypothetical protein
MTEYINFEIYNSVEILISTGNFFVTKVCSQASV